MEIFTLPSLYNDPGYIHEKCNENSYALLLHSL